MGNTGGEAQHDRGIKGFADIKSGFDEFPAFRGIGRFQYGYFGKSADAPIILFVLGAVHARIVGGKQNKTAFDSGESHRHQGIHCNVDPDMFHAGHGSSTADGGADGDLHGNFFVGRPLSVNFIVFGRNLGDLR